ncbi:MAG: M50 family metallopeptidase [Dehalococcoidales bacterium]|nr:M50 family metallopeptidase [Dehalococcoidales bacterium]
MGDIIFTVVTFVAVLVVLVIVHELGHFVTAKASGVTVEEFGLGFPPRLFGIRRGETIYSINLLPLGGFVKMAGEEDPDKPGSLAGKKPGTRILVLAAGSIMNAVLPLLLFTTAFMLPHDVVFSQVQVQEVKANSPASQAGIQAGDIVLRVDSRPVRNAGDLQRYIQLELGNETTMLVRHTDGTTETVRLVPRWRPPAGQGATGIVLKGLTPAFVSQHVSLWKAVPMGVNELFETFNLFKNGIISMFIGTAPVAVAGPVGIAQITGEVARSGFSPLLEFAAFLSINLAVINIFPLPALDGGRIAFVVLEWLRRGKRISPKIEGLVHLIGFALLMGAIAVVTYHDIVRIITGGSPIP